MVNDAPAEETAAGTATTAAATDNNYDTVNEPKHVNIDNNKEEKQITNIIFNYSSVNLTPK